MSPSPGIEIPRRFEAPLGLLAGLDTEVYDRLLTRLRGVTIESPIESAIDQVFNDTAEYTRDQLTALVTLALSLRRLVTDTQTSLDRLADAVALSFGSKRQDLDIDGLAARLTSLLESDYIALREKVDRLGAAGHTVAENIQLLTDARPVFSKGETGDPGDVVGFILLHKMTIETRNPANQRRAVTVALSDRDLLRIRQLVDRALTKAQRMTEALTASKFPLLLPSPEDRE